MYKCIILLVFVLLMGSSAQTLDEIIGKCLEVAGQEKLNHIESMTIKAMLLQGGIDNPLVIYKKRPMKYRTETMIQGKTMLQVYDGSNGYLINPFMNIKDPLAMDAELLEQMKDQADIDNILLTYKDKNYNLEYAGAEDMEGVKVLILKLTKPDGEVAKIYIDAEKYMVCKIVSKVLSQGVENEIESSFDNYKYVNGILFPFKYEQKIGGQVFVQISLVSFELNSNSPDSLFVVPAIVNGGNK